MIARSTIAGHGYRRRVRAGLALAAFAALLGLAAGCRTSSPARPGTSAGTRPPGPPFGATGTVQIGMATWYATGTMTASGEPYDKRAMTAAHRTLPFNTRVRVVHRKSGRAVTVRINDRGPFGSKKRVIDLSEAAAERLGIVDEGVAPVRVQVLRRGDGKRYRR